MPIPTESQKIDILKDVRYEIRCVLRMHCRLKPEKKADQDTTELMLLHVRVLWEFFGNEEQTYGDDVLALFYGKFEAKKLPSRLDCKVEVHKLLAHVTTTRIGRNTDWELGKMSKEILEHSVKFANEILGNEELPASEAAEWRDLLEDLNGRKLYFEQLQGVTGSTGAQTV